MKKKVLNILYITIIAILVSFLGILTYSKIAFFNVVVVGESMSGTLEEGEIGSCKKKGKTMSIKRGDIVVFDRSDYKESRYEVIKRVIGLPGDHIYLVDNSIYINDKLYEESYIKENNISELTNHGNVTYYDLTLDKDEYYVLGDNRAVSYDSRFYGAIKSGTIEGKLKVIYAKCDCNTNCEECKNKKPIGWRLY